MVILDTIIHNEDSWSSFNLEGDASQPITSTSKSMILLHTKIPHDVLVNEVLRKKLRDEDVKSFMEGLGNDRIRLLRLDDHYCTVHGCELEDGIASPLSNSQLSATQPQQKKEIKKRNCPECFSEQYGMKRCGRCLQFHPRGSNGSGPPIPNGLWCQKCDKMAFCNTCLASPTPCAGSGSDAGIPGYSTKRRCKTSKCTYCCPNVFTNTICGEYVCEDCATAAQTTDGSCSRARIATYDCTVCGKATCLDEHCLICAEYRLLDESIQGGTIDIERDLQKKKYQGCALVMLLPVIFAYFW